MDAHKGLDRFDDPLGVPDQVRIDILWPKSIGEPSQETRQVDDLAMRPAHRPKSMPVRQVPSDMRIDLTFVVPLVGYDLIRNDSICFRNHGDSAGPFCAVQRVCNFPQAVECRLQSLVICLKRAHRLDGHRSPTVRMPWPP